MICKAPKSQKESGTSTITRLFTIYLLHDACCTFVSVYFSDFIFYFKLFSFFISSCARLKWQLVCQFSNAYLISYHIQPAVHDSVFMLQDNSAYSSDQISSDYYHLMLCDVINYHQDYPFWQSSSMPNSPGGRRTCWGDRFIRLSGQYDWLLWWQQRRNPSSDRTGADLHATAGKKDLEIRHQTGY